MIVLATKKLLATADDIRVAKFAAFSIGLAMIDTLIPSPIPGIKPGLANIVTLLVMRQFSFHLALYVTFLRIFANSWILGGFLTPSFIMSLAGGGCSLAALFVVYRLPGTGLIGCSIVAAFAHIMGQMLLVRFWLIQDSGVWYMLPVFLSAALFFGLVNGIIAAKLEKWLLRIKIQSRSRFK